MAVNQTDFSGYGMKMLLAQGVAGVLGAYGSIGVTKHNNAVAQANANIARLNAQIMERKAQATLRQTEKNIETLTLKAGQTKASQRAALAANGISVGVGSAAELQASTDLIKEIDKNQAKSNGLAEAWGYRMQGANYEGQALMSEASKQNPKNVFATSLLSVASQLSNSYMMLGANGFWDKGLQSPAPIREASVISVK